MGRQMVTMDGNTAAAWVSYAFTDVAAIYPITPSSNMAEYADEWAAKGRKNIFGQEVKIVEMQSEAGAAGAVHGSLAAGALTTTYTASQGLLLMIPNMYKIAGELLPGVIHVSARAVAAHALSIFGDHSDVMACRQTGFAMLASNNAQEVMDLGAVAHMASIESRVPFLHFFDGFRTSHEMSKIEAWDYEDLDEMVNHDAIDAFRANALNPEHPVLRGSAQNPDMFFQAKESANPFYNKVPDIVDVYMKKVNEKVGKNYDLFEYYGAPDADRVIIAMGSVCDTIEETIDYLVEKGEKVGLVKIRLYRPFKIDRFLGKIPKSVKKIAVLDRSKEPGAIGEPLYLDVCAAYLNEDARPLIVGGRYGLGSKDTTPAHILSVYKNLLSDDPKNGFTISINDDVTNLSLVSDENPDTSAKGTISCKFWGLGSDGTVGANKNSIMIIGDHTDMYAQAYFAYDSKKSGGVTVSHLRFGSSPIKSTYLINQADFIACSQPSYVDKFKIVQDIKPGGKFLLNCAWDVDELSAHLPADMKRYIAQNNISFYTVDAIGIAREIGMGGRTNTILQSAFFFLANVIPFDDAVKYMKEAVVKSYGSRGERVVAMNNDAIDQGYQAITEIAVPAEWADAVDEVKESESYGDFIEKIMLPANAQQGDNIPVSAFVGREDGTLPQGTAAYEKRGIAVDVPEWVPENCIQCNQCSYVCPHSVIRPYILSKEETQNAPGGMKKIDKVIGRGLEDMTFALAVSTFDCTGCGSCAQVCPSKEKALVMKPIDTQAKEQDYFNYAITTSVKELPFGKTTLKGSQFSQPLLEFSGACAGCGETPYAKLVTQLFGDRMYIANATGCSSIWGGSSPSTPYTTNKDGHGPAWANSLFEDNAEYGFGMALGVNQRRKKLAEDVKALIAHEWTCAELKEAAQNWLDAMDDGDLSKAASAAFVDALIDGTDLGDGSEFTGEYEKYWDKENKWCLCDACALARDILKAKDVFVKKSVWVFGGDGWAYDIGFGGLDHVIASGEDVNILVFDTEVYSNTGGQASKSTPTGSVAQFAASGKSMKKKDLAAIAMSYGYVYVAQIGMGADMNQTIKAITEAENYKGPSIVIAYSPCIAHGMRGGMSRSQEQIKDAVAAGYWHNFRFNPELKSEGKNPFTLDSKAPTTSYKDFILGENRYSSLTMSFPERAENLFDSAVKDAADKYEYLVRLAKLYE